MFSLDPFDLSQAQTLALPGLYWGLDKTTCQVTVSAAVTYPEAGENISGGWVGGRE